MHFPAKLQMNPANVPKARPIEDCWRNLKAKVYESDWKAKKFKGSECENGVLNVMYFLKELNFIKVKLKSRHGLVYSVYVYSVILEIMFQSNAVALMQKWCKSGRDIFTNYKRY
ncbi:putative erlin-2-B-like [Brachionus plicatilis]|uniref:Putative erlin-2-B-like n=1 Tax=Brachionus plicatilis TaxID=10195 RepID=A0A3M7SWI5_BRAPC|nr:putative erlin-2-B-like [Brachionus plicatilis]